MGNVGYTGIGWGQLFLFLVLLPTMINVIKYLFSLNNTVYVEPQEYMATNISYHIGDNIGGNKNTKNIHRLVHKSPNTKEPRQTSKIKKKTKNLNEAFGIKPMPETAKEIKDNTALALKSLGFKASEANKMIRKLCINKCYAREEDLISDVISGINNE